MSRKSMRNANIRISAVNNTKEGIITYTKEDILEILNGWCLTSNLEYFFIEHKEDIENIHYHIVIKFPTPTKFDTIKNKFNYGNIESSKSLVNSIQYLIHLNDTEKVQYKWEDIITNSENLHKYKLKSKVSEELDLQTIINDIDFGLINEYNLYDKVSIEMYSKHKTRIKNALEYAIDKRISDKNRKIKVLFFNGSSGSGKTTYAKYFCDKMNKSYCVSSSSNDPLQDYKGEEVLILDDLRDSSFSFEDLLKILDNHTNSSIKSRYRNKWFLGDTIIITSSVELIDWYKNALEFEEIKQLHRRIPLMLKFRNNMINYFMYDDEKRKYFKFQEKENEIYDFYKQDRNLLDEISEMYGDIL